MNKQTKNQNQQKTNQQTNSHHPKAEHQSSQAADLAQTENAEDKSAFKQMAHSTSGEIVHRSAHAPA